MGLQLGAKSAALLAAPGVLEPTAFYACINILHFLPRGGQGPPKSRGVRAHVGAMLAHFSLLDAVFSLLAASCALLRYFLAFLVAFLTFWTVSGSILEGSRGVRGGFWRLLKPIFRCLFARHKDIARKTSILEKPLKTSTGAIKFKVRALTPYAKINQKTTKTRTESFSKATIYEGRDKNWPWDSPGSILEPLGRLLDVPWASFGRSWAPLGHSWALLGASWAILGRFLDALWRLLDAS